MELIYPMRIGLCKALCRRRFSGQVFSGVVRNLTLALVFYLLPIQPAYPDNWSFPAELEETAYEFGTITVIRGVDARTNQAYPRFYVRILSDGEQLALFPGLYFQHIAASSGNTLFAAISNSGIPSVAVVVFDARGEIRLLLNHHQGNLEYCAQSITLVREWYDTEDPQLRFQYAAGGETTGVTVQSCNGGTINVLDLASNP